MSNIDAGTYGYYGDANNRVLFQTISACTNGTIHARDIEFNNLSPYYGNSNLQTAEKHTPYLRTTAMSKTRVVVTVHIQNITALRFASKEAAYNITTNVLKNSVLSGRFNTLLALRSSATSSDALDGVISNQITFVYLDSDDDPATTHTDDEYHQWKQTWLPKKAILGLGIGGSMIMLFAFLLRVLYIRHYHRHLLYKPQQLKTARVIPIVAMPVCDDVSIQPNACLEDAHALPDSSIIH